MSDQIASPDGGGPTFGSESGPPRGPVATLPIWGTTKATFRTVLLDNFSYLPRAALLPFLLSLVLGYVQFELAPPLETMEGQTLPEGESPLLYLLFSLASFLPYVIFAISWHRLVLLGPEAGRPPLLPGWKGRHWRFLGYGVALLLIYILVSIPMMILYGVGLFLLIDPGVAQTGELPAGFGFYYLAVMAGMILVFIVLLRFSFVFPAQAVDERYGLRDSWRQTRGQGWRMFLVLLLVSLFLLIPAAIFLGFAASTLGIAPVLMGMMQGEPLATGILIAGVLPFLAFFLALSYVSLALTVSILSIAFRTCSGWVPHSE